jgi:hypothetical protein
MSKIINLIVQVLVPDRAINDDVSRYLLNLGSKLVADNIPTLGWNGIEGTSVYTHIEDHNNLENNFDLSILLHSVQFKIVDNYVCGLVDKT